MSLFSFSLMNRQRAHILPSSFIRQVPSCVVPKAWILLIDSTFFCQSVVVKQLQWFLYFMQMIHRKITPIGHICKQFYSSDLFTVIHTLSKFYVIHSHKKSVKGCSKSPWNSMRWKVHIEWILSHSFNADFPYWVNIIKKFTLIAIKDKKECSPDRFWALQNGIPL